MTGIAEELLSQSSEPVVEPQAEPEPVEAVEPTEPEAVQTPTEEPSEPETGVKDTVEPPATDSAVNVPLAALTGEREKRQAAQHELDALRRQLAEKEKTPPPSVFEDEEGAFNAIKDSLREETNNQLLNAGQALAVSQFDQETVDKAVEWIAGAVGTSPYLATQFSQVPLLQQHQKAVELYQQELARAEMENPAELKERLKAEARAEILAEQKAKQEEKDKIAQSIPTSLVGDSSKGGLSGSDWSGPTPLENLIGSGG